jgi:hypothetical protein
MSRRSFLSQTTSPSCRSTKATRFNPVLRQAQDLWRFTRDIRFLGSPKDAPGLQIYDDILDNRCFAWNKRSHGV